jgi:hypothetical protein
LGSNPNGLTNIFDNQLQCFTSDGYWISVRVGPVPVIQKIADRSASTELRGSVSPFSMRLRSARVS